jgi:cobalamin biosynthesis protein CobT
MKSGASSDPFAEEADTESSTDEEATDSTSESEATTETNETTSSTEDDQNHSSSMETETTTSSDTAGNSSDTATETTDSESESATQTADQTEIPWIFRRDKVKADRPNVHQLFVRPETDRKYRQFESTLETEMDVDLSRLDVREAVYLVGMRHTNEVRSLLESWGYNYFDE